MHEQYQSQICSSSGHQDETSQETQALEETIVNNFVENVKNDNLLKFSISAIYRILSKYTSIHGKQESQDEIINLFFKCLDKFGRDASPLLEFIDFNDDKTDLMNILTTKYSNVIDFTFLNISTIPFLHQYQAKYNEVQNDIATLKELFISKNEAMQKEIDELRKKQIDDNKTIDDLMKLNDELKREISNFKSSQNECFGIGDVILSSRNFSENECWLECNGKSISKTEYPDLFDALRTDQDYEWNKHKIDVPLKWKPYCIFYDNDYLIYISSNEVNILRIYSKKNSIDSWEKVIKEIPNGSIFSKFHDVQMIFANNEYVFPILIKEGNDINLYLIHSQSPTADWKITKKCPIKASDDKSVSFIITSFYYLNNTYVISIRDSYNLNLFAYGSDISSEFNFNTNFCNMILYPFALLAYSKNEWVLCIKHNNDSSVYFSNDIASLSPVSKQTIFHRDDKSDYFIPHGIQVEDILLVVIGNRNSAAAIYYSYDNTTLACTILDGFKIYLYNSFRIWNEQLFAICIKEKIKNQENTLIPFMIPFMIYLNKNNFKEWKEYQLDSQSIYYGSSNIYSLSIIKNTLKCAFVTQNCEIMYLNCTSNDMNISLPEYPQVKKLTAYIKAKK